MITSASSGRRINAMIVNEKYPLSELTGKIIGCAMEVHKALGNGFQEVIYQRALEIEMQQQRIKFSREQEMDIFYKGFQIGTRRVDFLVERKVMVELKAIVELEDVHLAQAVNYPRCKQRGIKKTTLSAPRGRVLNPRPPLAGINYLEAYGLEVGLLINVGSKSLQFKRVSKPTHKPREQS